MGRSPDLFDWAAIIVEGARRLGFKIGYETKILVESDESPDDPVRKAEAAFDKFIAGALLNRN